MNRLRLIVALFLLLFLATHTLFGQKNENQYQRIVNEILFRSQNLERGVNDAYLYSEYENVKIDTLLKRKFEIEQEFFGSKNRGDDRLTSDRRILVKDLKDPQLRDLYARSTVLIVPRERPFFDIGNTYRARASDRKQLKDHLKVSQIKFGDETITRKGSRTGVIVGSQLVLTAGHGLKKGDPVVAILKYCEKTNFSVKKEEERIQYFVTGTVVCARSGAPTEPDWALIELGFKIKSPYIMDIRIPVNDPIKGVKPMDWSIPIDYSQFANKIRKKEIKMLTHPLGMSMVLDTLGQKNENYPNYRWKNYPFYFANLNTSSGSSGSPVFWEEENSSVKKLYLAGIVVSNPIATDFYKTSDSSYEWNLKPSGGGLGTRVMLITPELRECISKYSGKDTSQCKFVGNPNIGDESARTLGAWKNYFNDSIDIIDNVQPYFRYKYLVYGRSAIEIDTTFVFTLKDNRLYYKRGVGLEYFYSDAVQPMLEYRNEVFSTDAILNSCSYFKFWKEESGNYVLDGIGTADILDNLPSENSLLRRLTWLFQGEYIEITPIDIGNSRLYNVRCAKGLVSMITSTKKNECMY